MTEMSSSAASSIAFCFVSITLLIVALGIFAIWAEFNSRGKQNEYDRYKYVEIDEATLIPVHYTRVVERIEGWAYPYTAYQY